MEVGDSRWVRQRAAGHPNYHENVYMDRRVTPPKRVTSPTWGPPSPWKQARRRKSDKIGLERDDFRSKGVLHLNNLEFVREKKGKNSHFLWSGTKWFLI